MIPNGEKRKAKSEEQLFHYLVVKKLSALLRGITSKESWWFLLSELPSFLQNKKETQNRRVRENKKFL